MEMNSSNVEAVVKQVLESMLNQQVSAPAAKSAARKSGNSKNSTCSNVDCFGAL